MLKPVMWLVDSECEHCLGFGFVEAFADDAVQTLTRSVCVCVVPVPAEEVESDRSAYSAARARFLREARPSIPPPAEVDAGQEAE